MRKPCRPRQPERWRSRNCLAKRQRDQRGRPGYRRSSWPVVRFPADNANFSGEMASELEALVDSNTVRVLDLVMVIKGDDGSLEASELSDFDDSEVGELRALERDLAILLAEEAVEEIGESLEPGRAAAVLVWENTWAAPFGSAVHRSGGELVASGRIPTQALIAAVQADRWV